MTFRQGAQHRRCRSLTFAWTITPDCERHELWNRVDIFFVPIRESMLKSFVSYKTFLVRSQKGKKKCVSKDIFCSPTTIVDDDNNKHRCRQCPSNPEHFPKVRTTYIHSYKLTAQCLLLLRVVATKMKTLTNIGVWRWSITIINRN